MHPPVSYKPVVTRIGCQAVGPVLVGLLVGACCGLGHRHKEASSRNLDVFLPASAQRKALAASHQMILSLQLSALSETLGLALETKPLPLMTPQRLTAPIGEIDAGYEVAAELNSLHLAAKEGCKSCLRVGGELLLSGRPVWTGAGPGAGALVLRATGLEEALGIQLRIPFHSELSVVLRQDNPGLASLAVDLRSLLQQALEQATRLVENKHRSAIAQVLQGSKDLLQGDDPIWYELLTVRLASGWGPVQLHLAAFEIRCTEDRLVLGLDTNLRLPHGGSPSLDRLPRQDEAVMLLMAPGLAEAVARALLASGIIPARFDGKMQPDKEGSLHITLDRLAPEKDALRADFRLWRLIWPCLVAGFSWTAKVDAEANGNFALHAEPMELRFASNFQDKLRRAIQDQSESVKTIVQVGNQVLNQQVFYLPDRTGIAWQPTRWRLDPDRVEIHGRFRIER